MDEKMDKCWYNEDMHSVVTGDKKKSGIIRKYGLNMSRQAFREHAKEIGFIKVCGSGKRVWGAGGLTVLLVPMS